MTGIVPYKNKVDSCDFCEQGWIEIKKHSRTKKIIFKCSECFTEYASYEEISENGIPQDERDDYPIDLTDKELIENNLVHLIIKEWENGNLIRNDGRIIKYWCKEKQKFIDPNKKSFDIPIVRQYTNNYSGDEILLEIIWFIETGTYRDITLGMTRQSADNLWGNLVDLSISKDTDKLEYGELRLNFKNEVLTSLSIHFDEVENLQFISNQLIALIRKSNINLKSHTIENYVVGYTSKSGVTIINLIDEGQELLNIIYLNGYS
jgi:hypothetical protein